MLEVSEHGTPPDKTDRVDAMGGGSARRRTGPGMLELWLKMRPEPGSGGGPGQSRLKKIPMNLNCTLLLLAFASLAVAQAPEGSVAEREVRAVLERYFAAQQAGNREAVVALSRPDGARFSPGGTKLTLVPGRTSGGRKISYFVRHIAFPRPDVSLAVGVWRDTDPGAAYPSGAFSYTLAAEGGGWKLATVQETLIQPLPRLERVVPPVQKDGDWEVLFDGQSAVHWLTVDGAGDLGKSWRVAEGCLIAIPGGPSADLRSDREYRSFELVWEWMAAQGSNSGVKYRLYGADMVTFGVPRYATGWEYQMADDEGDAGARVDDRQKSGALYGVVAVSKAAAKPAGEWNRSRLVVTDDHVEHWLNGVMTAQYPVDVAFDSPLLLQHHASEVRFRSIRARRIVAK